MADIIYVGTDVAGSPGQVGGEIVVSLGARMLQTLDQGVVWKINEIEGWWEPTSTTGQVDQRSHQPGGRPNTAYPTARRLVVRGSIHAPDGALALRAIDELNNLIPVNVLTPLAVYEEGTTRHVMARQEDRPVIKRVVKEHVNWDVQLVAPDYRKLAGDGLGALSGGSTGLPSQSGGRARPLTLPSMIDATVVSGIITMSNQGNAPARVQARIDGPVQKPSLQLSDGQLLRMDLDLTAGEWLEFDFDSKTVMLNGQSSRRGYLRGNWLQFTPGTNTIRFDAASPAPLARLSVTWSDAWK